MVERKSVKPKKKGEHAGGAANAVPELWVVFVTVVKERK
jgi:hypothetical protein